MINSEINSYKYEQYDSVWCKVVSIEEMDNPVTDKKIIYECIEAVHLYYTSESWCDSYQLQESNWQKSEEEHIAIVEEMIKGVDFYRNKERKEQAEYRDELFSYIDFEGGIEAYKKASPKKKSYIIDYIKKHYNPINEEDLLPIQDFIDYKNLKNEFLDTLFYKDVRYYFNKNVQQAKAAIYNRDRQNVPAIIAIDKEKAALLWFNF